MSNDPTTDNVILGILQAGGSSGSGGGPATQITETGGPTTLNIAAIPDGTFLKRVGTTVVGATPAGAGTVTSVDMTVPAFLTVTGNPITSSGTLAVAYSGTALPLANGGTAATSAAGALTSLGAAKSGANSDITSLTGLTTPIPIAEGGTNATSAGAALTNLGAAGVASNNTFTGSNVFSTSTIPVTITPGAASAVSPPTHFQFTNPADTALSNGVLGLPDVVFDLSATKQWGGNTAVVGYKAFQIKAPVLSSTTATTTFTGPTTFSIEGPPTAGTNATASGGIALLVNSGNMTVNAGTLTLKGAPSNMVVTQSAASSGQAASFSLAGAAHTNQTAGSNLTQFSLNFGQTQQHATGAVTVNDTVLITAPTLSSVAASTYTDVSTVSISGAPAVGANSTFTNQPSAIWAKAGQIRTDGNFMASPAAAPGILQNGQSWVDSTRQAVAWRLAGLTQLASMVGFVATADATVANSAAETTIVGSGVGTMTLPANFLVPGKTVRVTVRGILSNAALATLRVRFFYGATQLLDSTAVGLLGTNTNSFFMFSGSFTCRTTGATGTVLPTGNLTYNNSTTSQANGLVVTGPVTIDTTSANLIDVKITWGAASASNTLTGQMVIAELLS